MSCFRTFFSWYWIDVLTTISRIYTCDPHWMCFCAREVHMSLWSLSDLFPPPLRWTSQTNDGQATFELLSSLGWREHVDLHRFCVFHAQFQFQLLEAYFLLFHHLKPLHDLEESKHVSIEFASNLKTLPKQAHIQTLSIKTFQLEEYNIYCIQNPNPEQAEMLVLRNSWVWRLWDSDQGPRVLFSKRRLYWHHSKSLSLPVKLARLW